MDIDKIVWKCFIQMNGKLRVRNIFALFWNTLGKLMDNFCIYDISQKCFLKITRKLRDRVLVSSVVGSLECNHEILNTIDLLP